MAQLKVRPSTLPKNWLLSTSSSFAQPGFTPCLSVALNNAPHTFCCSFSHTLIMTFSPTASLVSTFVTHPKECKSWRLIWEVIWDLGLGSGSRMRRLLSDHYGRHHLDPDPNP